MLFNKGPREPEWIRWERWMYYENRRWVGEIEARICVTDSGLLWLMRIKKL
jgi:hypothetical protein